MEAEQVGAVRGDDVPTARYEDDREVNENGSVAGEGEDGSVAGEVDIAEFDPVRGVDEADDAL